jgi:NADH-quinone oxidoreductase subunit H
LAITALSVYGVALAGWSSNSKYPLLGGLRSSAQMVSYELGAHHVYVVGVLLMAGSFSLRDIVLRPGILHPELGIFGWNIWPQILGFLCFFIAAIAETEPRALRSSWKPNLNWSRAFTPNIPASSSPCSSLLSTPA